jgi:FlgD Ig-like domain
MKMAPVFFALLMLAACVSVAMADTQVFYTDFESGLPAQMTAPGCTIEPVQGYNNLGPAGNKFSGNLLRYAAVPLSDTQLTLTGLPAHDHLSLAFLAAIIDSWDGTELWKVTIDGTEVFSHWWEIAVGDNSNYVAPAGGLLSSGVNLGWNGGSYFWKDRAYNMGVDPVFTVAHTASTVTIVWKIGAISGPAASQWQGGLDESWGIDNVKVSVSTTATAVGDTPSASAITLLPNSPNPFSGGTMFRAALSHNAGSAHIDVFDISGRRVAERTVSSTGGVQDLYFDGRDSKGNQLPSGVYFYRLTVGTESRTQKFIIMR